MAGLGRRLCFIARGPAPEAVEFPTPSVPPSPVSVLGEVTHDRQGAWSTRWGWKSGHSVEARVPVQGAMLCDRCFRTEWG